MRRTGTVQPTGLTALTEPTARKGTTGWMKSALTAEPASEAGGLSIGDRDSGRDKWVASTGRALGAGVSDDFG